jgi:hypothetical protein
MSMAIGGLQLALNEVTGSPSVSWPANAILDENGDPIIDEDGAYILEE